jgi:thiol-disulfide isomerase/thioredoxin
VTSRLRGAALTLAAVLLAAGCSSEEAPAWQPAPAAEQNAAQQSTGEQPVPETLQFTGTTLDGKKFDAATLAGKPALLWFWAPWCATCASEAMSVSDLAEKYEGKLGILGIAGMGSNADMHEFVSDLEVGAVPHLDDQDGKIWKRFKITQQSWYVVVDRAGKVVKTAYLDDLQLTAEVKSLLTA